MVIIFLDTNVFLIFSSFMNIFNFIKIKYELNMNNFFYDSCLLNFYHDPKQINSQAAYIMIIRCTHQLSSEKNY